MTTWVSSCRIAAIGRRSRTASQFTAMTRRDGSKKEVPVLLRIDTPIEVDYYMHGGILPYVLRDLLAKSGAAAAVTA